MSVAVSLVRFTELEPSWDVKRATEPGFMRWVVSWLGGPPGFVNFNPGVAADSARTAAGLMGFLPSGNRDAREPEAFDRLFLCVGARIVARHGTGTDALSYLDAVHVPAGAFWNPGDGTAPVLWLEERGC